MTSLGTTFVLSGIACLGASGLLASRIAAREGRPPSILTKTDARATAVALVLVIMFAAGIGLLMKGLYI